MNRFAETMQQAAGQERRNSCKPNNAKADIFHNRMLLYLPIRHLLLNITAAAAYYARPRVAHRPRILNEYKRTMLSPFESESTRKQRKRKMLMPDGHSAPRPRHSVPSTPALFLFKKKILGWWVL